jgi:hypothetical protein
MELLLLKERTYAMFRLGGTEAGVHKMSKYDNIIVSCSDKPLPVYFSYHHRCEETMAQRTNHDGRKVDWRQSGFY